jgi:hypothetical protein
MLYVHDSFATIADVYGEMWAHHLTEKAQMTYPKGMAAPAVDGPVSTGRAIGSMRVSPQASSRQTQEDSTASFREEMGIQDPQGALTMEELLDHEGSVWVVLKQHNRSNNRLLAVFGCPVNAQFYAKTHRGFQKRYDSVTDMFEESNGRGIIQPLKAEYYAALGRRANEAATPSTPEHRQQGKRTRIRSPGNTTTSTSSGGSCSTISSRGILPHHQDPFAQQVAAVSAEWQFDHIDPQVVSSITGLCPDENLEQLRTLLGIITDPNVAIAQVMAWRTTTPKNQNERV